MEFKCENPFSLAGVLSPPSSYSLVSKAVLLLPGEKRCNLHGRWGKDLQDPNRPADRAFPATKYRSRFSTVWSDGSAQTMDLLCASFYPFLRTISKLKVLSQHCQHQYTDEPADVGEHIAIDTNIRKNNASVGEHVAIYPTH